MGSNKPATRRISAWTSLRQEGGSAQNGAASVRERECAWGAATAAGTATRPMQGGMASVFPGNGDGGSDETRPQLSVVREVADGGGHAGEAGPMWKGGGAASLRPLARQAECKAKGLGSLEVRNGGMMGAGAGLSEKRPCGWEATEDSTDCLAALNREVGKRRDTGRVTSLEAEGLLPPMPGPGEILLPLGLVWRSLSAAIRLPQEPKGFFTVSLQVLLEGAAVGSIRVTSAAFKGLEGWLSYEGMMPEIVELDWGATMDLLPAGAIAPPQVRPAPDYLRFGKVEPKESGRVALPNRSEQVAEALSQTDVMGVLVSSVEGRLESARGDVPGDAAAVAQALPELWGSCRTFYAAAGSGGGSGAADVFMLCLPACYMAGVRSERHFVVSFHTTHRISANHLHDLQRAAEALKQR